VILGRQGNAETAPHHLRKIMGRLKRTVNEGKIRIARKPVKSVLILTNIMEGGTRWQSRQQSS
jgi:hypothetical protein